MTTTSQSSYYKYNHSEKGQVRRERFYAKHGLPPSGMHRFVKAWRKREIRNVKTLSVLYL